MPDYRLLESDDQRLLENDDFRLLESDGGGSPVEVFLTPVGVDWIPVAADAAAPVPADPTTFI